jgi:hypothetical protein
MLPASAAYCAFVSLVALTLLVLAVGTLIGVRAATSAVVERAGGMLSTTASGCSGTP